MTTIERLRYRRKVREELEKNYGPIFWISNSKKCMIEFGTTDENGRAKDDIGYMDCATDKITYLLGHNSQGGN